MRVRHSVVLVLGWLAALTPAAARAAGFSIDMNGTSVSVGEVRPGQTAVVGYATQLTINASAPWTLEADAPAGFTTSSGLTMPVDRLEWRFHGLGGAFTKFVAGLQTILAGQPPTPASGRTVVLDLRLVPEYGDLPNADGDPYRAVIGYTVTAGTIDSAYAWPNPFSPDGDGVNDRTFIHWYQGQARVVDVLIYEPDGTTLVRTLTLAAPLGAGEQVIDWDGRDDERNLAPEGEYLFRVRVSPSEAVNPGLTLASGLIGLERGVGSGTATVWGVVTSISSTEVKPLAGATVELYRAGGNRAGVTTTDATGTYTLSGVGAGLYYVQASAPLHFEAKTNQFEVASGANVRVDVSLAHNHSLTITKLASVADVEPGDVVSYEVKLSTQGGVETVQDVEVHDLLPEGLRLVPGTARLEGEPVMGDHVRRSSVLRGRVVRFPVGEIPPGRTVTLRYEAVVLVGTRPGPITNSARATGKVLGNPVQTGTTHATIYVHGGEVGDRSLVFGRIFVDVDGDGRFGPGDRPLPASRIVLDDGTIVTVDGLGRYSIKGVREGARAILAVANPDPQGVAVALVPTGPSKLRVADVKYGVAVNVDFPFTEDELVAGGSGDARTAVGVVDVKIGLDLDEAADGGVLPVLRLIGRAAGFVERDLGDGYRLTGSIDTRRDPRDEMGIGRDQLSFQPEVGDESSTLAGPPDRIGVRLRAPWGGAQLGRSSVNLGEIELISTLRSYVGVDIDVGGKKWRARAFTGATAVMVRLDEIPNDGSTGPFTLSAAPLVPGSERVAAEARDASGHAVERRPLGRDIDYTIDYATGQIFLYAPFPLVSPSGERWVFLVEYEFAPREELPSTMILGARAEAWPVKGARVGATAFHEDGAPTGTSVVGMDARYLSERVVAQGEAAIADPGSRLPGVLPGEDPTALRVRATVRAHEKVDLYGFLSRVGGAYTPRIDFRSPSPSALTFGYLPPPSQTLFSPIIRSLFDGQRDFPFTLQGTPDRLEWGLGTQYRPRPDVDLSIGTYDIFNDLDDKPDLGRVTRHTDYVTARWHPSGRPELFLATTGTTQSGDRSSERAWIAGTRWLAGPLSVAAEYRLLDRDVPGSAGSTGHAGLIRGRWRKWLKLQPAALIEAGRTTANGCSRNCVEGENRLVAVGVESVLGDISTFVYGSIGEGFDPERSPEPIGFVGAFAGAAFGSRRLAGALRMDVTDDDLYGPQVGGGGRLRMIVTPWLMSFVSLNYKYGGPGASGAQWNNIFGVAIRPVVNPRFYTFLKFRDRSLPALREGEVPQRSQLAAADFVVPVTRRLSMATRGVWKRVRSSAGPVTTMVAAEDLTFRFWRRWEVVGGFRLAATDHGGEVLSGYTLGLGLWMDPVRLVVGVNYAAADWAFEADESIPGFFVNVTGAHGASAGTSAARVW